MSSELASTRSYPGQDSVGRASQQSLTLGYLSSRSSRAQSGVYTWSMSGGLRSHNFNRVYEASNADLAADFYIPAMMRATKYDRARRLL